MFMNVSYHPLVDANTKRETGRVAQLGNIQAAKVML